MDVHPAQKPVTQPAMKPAMEKPNAMLPILPKKVQKG